MKIIMNVFNFFIDAGPTVMLPVIITIIGLIFGLKISRVHIRWMLISGTITIWQSLVLWCIL